MAIRVDQLELVPISADSPELKEATRIYCDVWNAEYESSHRLISRYATYPDFHGRLALADSNAVGLGFGHRGFVGNWWYDRMLQEFGENHLVLKDAWVFVELAVQEAWRGKGVGTRLHNALLAAQGCPWAILSTAVGNLKAQQFYLKHGWQILHPGFVFREGQGPCVVMGIEWSRSV